MSNETKQRKVQIAVVKITKNEIDAALAAGNTHAKFTNRSVQKRLLKNQAIVKREQERRENQIRMMNKHREKLSNENISRMVDAAVKRAEARTSASTAAKAKKSLEEGAGARAAEKEQILAAIPAELKLDNIGPRGTFGDTMKIVEDGEEFVPSAKITDNYGGMGVIVKIDEDAPVDEAAVLQRLGYGSENNVFPLNLYGDENTYKPFPNIGDLVREDGMIVALRKGPATHSTEVDPVNDAVLYSVPGSVVAEPVVELVKKFCADRKVNEPENFASSTEPTDISSKVAAVIKSSEERVSGLNVYRPNHEFDPVNGDLSPFAGSVPHVSRSAMFGSHCEKVSSDQKAPDDDAAPDTSFALPA